MLTLAMHHPFPHFLVGSLLLLVGCGGSSPPPRASEAAGAGDETEGAAASAPGEPSDATGAGSTGGAPSDSSSAAASAAVKPPAPKTRMEHCQLLGPAMQQVQQVGPIANAGDGAKLLEMAKALRREAEPMAKAELSHKELAALRDLYVATTGEMAAALEAAAGTQNANEQKSAVERFRKLEPKLSEHIEKLNELCNAPGK